MLKILWSSVSPTLESGYGRVTREIVSRLIKHGYDIICHGYQSHGKPHTIDKTFKMVEAGDSEYGMRVLPKYFKKYNRDVLITLFDIWAFFGKIEYLGMPWMPYFPVDAEPVTPPMYEPLRHAFKPICFSQFAKKELEKVGILSTLIYHGVDTKVFKPLGQSKKIELRERAGIPKDAFMIGTNGANRWDRKDFPRMIRIFAEFVKKYKADNAIFYLHAVPYGEEGKAYSLIELGKLYNIERQLKFPPSLPFNDAGLAKMYNTFDVYFTASRAEGCGLPILEAQSCGISAIVPDNSAQPEWVRGHGWIVSCSDHIVALTTPQHNKWYLMDIDGAVEALGEAYLDTKKRKEYGRKARNEMLKYDWDKIVKEQWLPFLKQAEEDLKNPFDEQYLLKRGRDNRSIDYQQIIDNLIGSNVLELGCGDGELLLKLRNRGFYVKGVDISQEAVKIAQKSDVDVVRGDALNELKLLKDDSFDTVFSMHLLEHCEDDMAIIQESIKKAKIKAIHLIPLGLRGDWTHRRVYGIPDIMSRLKPTKTIIYPNGSALLIYLKVGKGKKG